jgi:hypothetical protein
MTEGCIRTTDEAMALINLYSAFNPLTEIDVQNNFDNIQNWANNAEASGIYVDDDLVSADAGQNDGFGPAPDADFGSNPTGGANDANAYFSNLHAQYQQQEMERECSAGSQAACN